MDLFGYWQTESFVNKLNDDGTLPRNEYNNYEVNDIILTEQTFNGPPPEGTVVVDLPFVAKVCKKHSIEHVEAVSGWDNSGGRNHIVKGGVLMFKKDLNLLEKVYSQEMLMINQEKKKKQLKELFKIWRKLFKAIVLKQ